MPRLIAALTLLAVLTLPVRAQWTQHVDPFIGTGGTGHTFPGATTPFGMVQLSPDTRIDDSWEGCAGYYYTDPHLYGFSHTHLSGTGISDYGDVMFMPTLGDTTTVREQYRSALDHAAEEASPGYYAVTLDSGIRVELTATTRVGLQRYTFPQDGWANVVLDLTHRDRLVSGSVERIGDRALQGHRHSSGWAEDQTLFFRTEFSKPFAAYYERTGPEGTRVVVLRFRVQDGETLLVKTALSGVDEDGAAANLRAELDGWDFDAVRGQADRTWNDELGNIQVEGGTVRAQTNFYTALYHVMIAPNLWSDVDGRYRGHDDQIHRADHDVYTVFSLWDTFRALHPLLTLIDPGRTRDFLRTFLLHYEQGGRLPVWELAANETDTMIGYHAVPVILDAYVKGIQDVDPEALLDAMVMAAETDIEGLPAFNAKGYLTVEDEPESVSRTLEYAYDHWVVGRMAKILEREGRLTQEGIGQVIADHFYGLSLGYRHVLDPDGFAHPRRNGGWLEGFDPREVNNHFTEANSWQYSFFVPHDIAGWMDRLGGASVPGSSPRQALEQHLDALFEAPEATTGRDQADITGLIGQYAHGNEPSHSFAYLYDYVGAGWKTQRRVRQILDTLYAPTPDGLPGNEDCGQMSAWFVFSAMGFYPVTPGTTTYALGTPLFDTVRLALPDGGFFTVRGNPDAGPYVQRVTLDGQPHEPLAIDHADLHDGGDLVFSLGAEPSSWGTPAPLTRVDDTGFVAAPTAQGARSFRDRQTITLASDDGLDLRYTTDGSAPSPDGMRYAGPFEIAETTTVRVQAFDADGHASPVVDARFVERPNNWALTLDAEYAPQYAGGGPDALIDGLTGDEEWRKGDWQGFYDQDLVATIDLGAVQPVRAVHARFLQDARPWILFPREVIVETSPDGETFREVLRTRPSVGPEDETPQVADLGGTLAESVQARYVRVRALTFGALPPGHLGAGYPAWVFADEIWVE